MNADRFSVFRDSKALFRKMRGSALFTVSFWMVVGVSGGLGFGSALDTTSTTGFCLSCHEMNVMQEELSRTSHFKNRAGVRAECDDCHVPEQLLHKFMAKIQALDDLYAHLKGTIDTPEKFEARRLAMAETVWAKMRADRSRACLTCHAFGAMEFAKQSSRPRRKHSVAIENGETCIDCHKGVAHALPAEFRNDDH